MIVNEAASSGIIDVVRKILRLIVQKDYEALEGLSGGKRLTANEIGGGFAEYPFDVVMPGEEDLAALIDVIPIRGADDKRRYSV